MIKFKALLLVENYGKNTITFQKNRSVIVQWKAQIASLKFGNFVTIFTSFK